MNFISLHLRYRLIDFCRYFFVSRSTGIRENWFNPVPQSSTESSDEN